ncbi:MAG: hypothetical protein EBV45_11435, partial [Chloroflexi bacterium]|nr:hypothetical protein [Chloroflexota bacterium]
MITSSRWVPTKLDGCLDPDDALEANRSLLDGSTRSGEAGGATTADFAASSLGTEASRHDESPVDVTDAGTFAPPRRSGVTPGSSGARGTTNPQLQHAPAI